MLVVSARGLQGLLLPPATLTDWRQELRVGDELDISETLARWVEGGYEPVVAVEGPGQFSRRGGLIDVYPMGATGPVRIELFGDEIDSLRPFDPTSQRSSGRLQTVTILPASELPLWEREAALERLRDLDTSSLRAEVLQEWERAIRLIDRGEAPPAPDLLAPYFMPDAATLLDYLPAEAVVVTDEPSAVRLAAEQVEAQAIELRFGFEASGELPRDMLRPFHTWTALTAAFARHPRVRLGESADPGLAPGARSEARRHDHRLRPTARAGRLRRADGAPRRRPDRLHAPRRPHRHRHRAGRAPARTPGRARRLPATRHRPVADAAAAADRRPRHPGERLDLRPPPTTTRRDDADEDGAFTKGVRAGAIVVLTDHDLFGTVRVARRGSRRSSAQHRAFVRSLTPGQYVVHLEHGIARYTGMITRTVGEAPPDGGPAPTREFLTLDYAAGDRLFVPIDQTDRVAPYTGTGDDEPTLNRLGSAEWAQTKSRVKRAVADMADELLALYAARESMPGHAFAPDSPWDRELEESFPYVETEDQLKAIDDVKGDMEQPRPMDRLVCGDVGFGKTEVALRAAFKAVNDGAQVAVLVPTTVLALQHSRTFNERLAPFPVRVEMLSRLRTTQEREQVKHGLATGDVDIVIGTHALLATDVRFKNLGLLVVDEEQRFGVRHKEKLKQLRATVDVLTMTATPIPRTLHMALAGIRDISVIETPPEDRLPIRTFVVPYSDTLVREVILREIDRGGQIYFVHNRVQTLPMVAAHLAELVPEARLRIGHGQMDEGQLEEVMLDFVKGEFDVLVCTTIIESGIDIPNVNTIIIDDAPYSA